MEVEFVTLGDASERLGVPSPTLRNWTDQLEEMGVHYVKRNNRNERVYYDNDIEIFEWLRDLKKEHGRKTTMKDLTNVMKGMEDRFVFRSEEEAPTPTTTPSNKTGDLITPDDMQRLMENQRVRSVINLFIKESGEQLRVQMVAELKQQLEEERDILKLTLREEIKKELSEGQEQLLKELKSHNEEETKKKEEERERVAKRDEQLMKSLREMQEKQAEKDKKELEQQKNEEQESKKGLFQRLFGG